ncbi:MAG TPA: LamG-like jellyroll fold domain-containing protein [Thermoguttaceae bacterium]|nr:LamG-like jellyroll fold domain-containing protein [Thermoguttaceae bacterium]
MKRLGLVAQLLAIALLAICPSAHAALVGMDIGSVGNPLLPGSFSYDAGTDTYTVNGGGTDIFNNDDHFYFAYEEVPLVGDAVIIARVTGLEVTNSWSKAGVMIRDQLIDVSTHASMIVSGDPRTSFQNRPLIGGSYSTTTNGLGARPYWVKLTRVGDTFTGYHSPDGLNWTMQDSVDIPMFSPYIGLAVTSHNNNQLAQATFDNLHFEEPAEMTWDGSDPNNWGSDHWNAAGAFPDGWAIATVNSGRVNVEADHSTLGLNLNGGTVAIGAGNSLTLVGLDATGGTIDIAAGGILTSNQLNGLASTVTLAGGATLAAPGTVGTAVTSGDATFQVDSGTLGVNSLTATGNKVTKSGAGTLVVNTAALDVGTLELGGGTTNVTGQITVTTQADALGMSGFLNSGRNNSDIQNIEYFSGIAGQAPVGTTWMTTGAGYDPGDPLADPPIPETPGRGLDYNGDAEFRAAIAEIDRDDDYQTLFTANFLASDGDGAYKFRIGADDDRSSLWLDLNQDGVFQADERLAWENGGDHWVDLVGGESYAVAVAHMEHGGGSRIQALYQTPFMLAEEIINPSTQPGIWTGTQTSIGSVNFSAPVVVTGDSTLQATTHDSGATFGALTLQNGVLTTAGAVSISFTGTTIAPGATAVGIDPQTQTDYNVIDGSATTGDFVFSKAGPSSLTIESGFMTGMGNAIIDAHGGTLTMMGPDSWEASTRARLSGGTLKVVGLPGEVNNVLNGSVYIGNPGNDDLINGIGDGTGTGGLLGEVPDQTLEGADAIVGRIDYRNDNDFRNGDAGLNSVGFSALQQNDNYETLFFGTFNAPETGIYEFGTNRTDDVARIYLDMNQNGVFETSENELIVTRNCCGNAYNPWVPLTEGESYKYAIAHREGTGGSNIEPTLKLPSWDTRQTVEPGAASQAGLWTGNGIAEVDLSGFTFSAIADSTLEVGSHAGAVLGTLDIDPDVTLTTAGNAPASFATIALNGAGDTTVGFHSNVNTLLTRDSGIAAGGRNVHIQINGSAQTIVNKAGSGLENTTFDLQSGELVGLIGTGLNTFGAASFAFDGGGLTISSTGGNQTFDQSLIVGGNGTLGAAEVPGGVGGVELTYGSASTGATMSNYAVLSFDARDGYTINVDGPVTGDGGIEAAGGTVNVTAVGAKDYAGITAVSAGTMMIDTPITSTSNVRVTGGTMVLNQPVITNGGFISDRIEWMRYDGGNNDANLLGIDDGVANGNNGGLFNLTPTSSGYWTTSLYDDGSGDNYAFMWTGVFRAPSTGDFQFHTHADDQEILWFDLNRNGDFEDAAGEAVAVSLPPEGWNSPHTATLSLVEGEQYAFAFAYYENSGGEFGQLEVTAPGGARMFLDPSDPGQTGWLGIATAPTTTVSNGTLEINSSLDTEAVTVGSGGTINVNPGGSLTADSLNVESGGVFDTQLPVTFTSVQAVKGGLANTNGNDLTVLDRFAAGSLEINADGGSFKVRGSDLVANVDLLTLDGGVIEVTDIRGDAPTGGLVGRWTFDDETINDSAGFALGNHNGTLSGGLYSSDVAVSGGKSLDLSQANNHYAVVDQFTGTATEDDFDLGSAMTVAVWVKGWPNGNWEPFVSKRGENDEGWQLRRNGGNNEASFTLRGTSGGDDIRGATDINNNEWKLVVGTYDGAQRILYVNGQVDAQIGDTGAIPDTGSLLVFGARDNSGTGAPPNIGNHARIMLDDIYIYDRPLSPAEIGMIYGAGFGTGDGSAFLNDVQGHGTLAGQVVIQGTVTPGDGTGSGIATLNLDGEIELLGSSIVDLEVNGLAHDQLVNVGDLETYLAGKLQLTPIGVGNVNPLDPGNNLGLHSYPLVTAVAEGVLHGQFDPPPPVITDPTDPNYDREKHLGHIGLGVFDHGLTYELADPNDPPVDPPGGYRSVTADLFIAKGGDGDGDGRVDGRDINTLIAEFSQFGDPADKNWTDNDTAGGPPLGRGDGLVDGQDINDLIANFSPADPGPAAPGTAIAEYNPATGEFIISVGSVMSWNIQSNGLFTQEGLLGVQDILPLGQGFTLVSANPSTVGEGAFGSQMIYTDVNLGPLVLPGTDVSEFTLEYVAGFGSPKEYGTITVVNVIPEPGTVAMLLSGLFGLLWFWRRRRA